MFYIQDVSKTIYFSLICIFQYVESIVASYMKIQKLGNTKQLKSWFSKGCFTSAQNIQRLAESLTYELAIGDSITRRALEVWLQGSTVLGQLLLFVFMHLYNISHKEKALSAGEKSSSSGQATVPTEDTGAICEKEKDRSLVPFCKGLDLIPSYPSRLDLNQIVFINAHLPQQYQLEWRFLFSSEIHGESFSTLIGNKIYLLCKQCY